jgi:glutamine amidotransferase
MTNFSVVIVDYDVGNTWSVANAVAALGYKNLKVSRSGHDLLKADALILPGVGAFNVCAENLHKEGLSETLNEAVQVKKTPILGICVGMQLMATASDENGAHYGLNWVPGQVVQLTSSRSYAVPHVGWNDITHLRDNAFSSNVPDGSHFYFDHSFHYLCEKEFILMQCDYGAQITAAIAKDHIYGVQFHPEKSQTNGLKIFRSFFNTVARC